MEYKKEEKNGINNTYYGYYGTYYGTTPMEEKNGINNTLSAYQAEEIHLVIAHEYFSEINIY